MRTRGVDGERTHGWHACGITGTAQICRLHGNLAHDAAARGRDGEYVSLLRDNPGVHHLYAAGRPARAWQQRSAGGARPTGTLVVRRRPIARCPAVTPDPHVVVAAALNGPWRLNELTGRLVGCAGWEDPDEIGDTVALLLARWLRAPRGDPRRVRSPARPDRLGGGGASRPRFPAPRRVRADRLELTDLLVRGARSAKKVRQYRQKPLVPPDPVTHAVH